MKSFYNGHPQDKRTISIDVDKDFILFYFDNVLRAFKESQKINDQLGYEIEDETEATYFYWLGVNDWVESPEHWSAHMERKAWFTQEMQDYITQQIQKQK